MAQQTSIQIAGVLSFPGQSAVGNPPAGSALGYYDGTLYHVINSSGTDVLAVSASGLPSSGTWTFNGTIAGNPAFSGTPTFANALALGSSTATTQVGGTNNTTLATTAFVATSFAPLASPTFTGTPAAPTAAAYTNSTQLATTAYADRNLMQFNTAYIHEDFISFNGSSAVTTVVTFSGDSGTWALLQIAAACSISGVAGTFLNPGVVAFVTGATTNNGGVMYKTGGTASLATLGNPQATAGWEMNFFVNLPSTANVAIRMGAVIAGQNAADAPTGWLGCEYDTANGVTAPSSTGYTLVGRSAATSSSAGNTVAPTGGTTYDHIRIFSTVAGTIQMSINGANTVSVNGANVPNAAVGIFFQAITRTTAAKTVNFDATSYFAATGRT